MDFLDHSRRPPVKETIEQVAGANNTVLIRRESGVGKDIMERLIHAASPRRSLPFIRASCSVLPAEVLDSGLFGHEKGAFAGACRSKLGKFEYANGGTILLGRNAMLPPEMLTVFQRFAWPGNVRERRPVMFFSPLGVRSGATSPATSWALSGLRRCPLLAGKG